MSKIPTVPPTATRSIAHWPTQQKIERAKYCLDRLVEHHEAMSNAARSLKQEPSDSELKRARTVLERYATSGARKSVADGHLETLLNECEPTDWLDDNGDVRKSEIAKMIAMLLGSFSTSNIPNPAVFAQVLIDDVMARNPYFFVALECTCREIRTRQKFMPAICEVISELDKQKDAWDERDDALHEIEDRYAELVKLVASTEQKLEAEAKAVQRKAAKAAPPVVGDRVRHLKFGAGTVTERIEVWGDRHDHHRVLFDSSGESRYVAGMDCLEKLIEGDETYTAPILMLEHNSSLPMAPLHDECQTDTNRTLI